MELRDFVDNDLFPAMWGRLNELFPEMEFKYERGKWRSPKNLDGSSPQTPRKDKTVVTQRFHHVALENGGGDARGRAKDLITLYQEHNGQNDRIEAIKEISRILGLIVPEGANAEKYEEARRRREEMALSYDRQRRALFSPEGAEALAYLKEKRGYSEKLIQDMGLGYISPAEARTLQDRCNVGIAWNVKEYPLCIPYFSRGNVMGFKFRCIKPIEGKSKYMNTRNLGSEGMNSNPFGLTNSSLNLGDKKKEVIVVEGELDALHAIALGLANVIASAGGKVTGGKARVLKEMGYKNVIILLDSDAAGQTYTAESIETIDNIGLNSFVASLPDSKDVDEYLQKHSVDELREIIQRAGFGGLFLYIKERERYLAGSQTEIEFFGFLENYIHIASRYNDPVKREILFTYLRRDFEEVDIESIEKGIREKVEQRTREEERKRLRETASASLRAASSFLSEGNGREAIETAQDALETLREAEQETEFSFLLEDNTEELYRQYRESQTGLPTNIILKHKEGTQIVEYGLSFPSGAVSVIGAPTNHGKSKILQSLALDAMEDMENGETILYITYEENELNVNKQFLNAYANLLLTKQTSKGSNIKSITEDLCEGKTTFIRAEALPEYEKKKEEWKGIRRSMKIKIVKPEDNYLETLLGLINFAVKHLRIKAVFLDYIQEIYVRDWNKYSRTDELKEAMVQLDATAQKTNLPIIIAAQLKRETNSPLDLYNQYIADSGWIERKASEIVLVWSNKEKCKGDGLKKDTAVQIADDIESQLGTLNLGEGGKLYLKLTKSRVLPSGSHAIIPINGNTGRVGEHKKKEAKQTEMFRVRIPSLGEPQPDDNVKPDPEGQRPFKKEEEEELPF